MSLWISLREACVPITRVLHLSFVALIEQHIEVELSTRSKRATTSRKRRKILKMEWTFEFRMLLYLTHEVAICNTSIILLQLITNDPSFPKFLTFELAYIHLWPRKAHVLWIDLIWTFQTQFMQFVEIFDEVRVLLRWFHYGDHAVYVWITHINQ